MRIATHIGVSLDGFLAEADGTPTWDSLPKFDPSTHGYETFMQDVDAIVMGRTCFDQGFEDGWMDGWPWPGKPVLVVTSRPLQSDVPDSVQAARDPAEAVQKLHELGIERDVQLLGGQQAVKAFLDAGLLDRLGIVVLPLVLGRGIPLLPIEPVDFSTERWHARQASDDEPQKPPMMQLEGQETYADGSVRLAYAPTR
jgi:dihydrofolate reductase